MICQSWWVHRWRKERSCGRIGSLWYNWCCFSRRSCHSSTHLTFRHRTSALSWSSLSTGFHLVSFSNQSFKRMPRRAPLPCEKSVSTFYCPSLSQTSTVGKVFSVKLFHKLSKNTASRKPTKTSSLQAEHNQTTSAVSKTLPGFQNSKQNSKSTSKVESTSAILYFWINSVHGKQKAFKTQVSSCTPFQVSFYTYGYRQPYPFHCQNWGPIKHFAAQEVIKDSIWLARMECLELKARVDIPVADRLRAEHPSNGWPINAQSGWQEHHSKADKPLRRS